MTAMSLAQPKPRRLSAEDALALVRRYQATGDRGLRDRLVLTFAPLVKYIVYKKMREIPARCEVDDFISCGLEALIVSIDRFDPDRGATLEQFVWTRIHGAVIDELRRLDWAPRSVRRWERDMARAREQFLSLHGRMPERAELAAALSISVDELRRHEHDIATSDLTSLNGLVAGEEETAIERVDTIESEDIRLDPQHAAEISDAKDQFRRAFAGLPQREREVAVLLYVKNLTLREIGDVLGVSESRVCQIHSQLKRRLRERLGEHEHLLSAVG